MRMKPDIVNVRELNRLAKMCADAIKYRLRLDFFSETYNSLPTKAVFLGTASQGVLNDNNDAEHLSSLFLPDILPFQVPENSAAQHKRTLELRKIGQELVFIFRGRIHYYDVWDQRWATFAVRIAKELGVEELILTQAAGALNSKFNVMDFVILDSGYRYEHPDPYAKTWCDPKSEEAPILFYDPSKPFDVELRTGLINIAIQEKIAHQDFGTLSLITGPGFEDLGQRKILSQYADVAGMSTGNEAVVAKRMGMKVAGISVLTDECKPGVDIIQADIDEVSEKTQPFMNKLLLTHYKSPVTVAV